MIHNKIIKLKKYLFLISVLFLVISSIHLIYLFLYNDSKTLPVKWGTVSEWLIWNFPSLNPLEPLSWNNKYMIDLLYRSLLKYDLTEKKIVWDLASCDISNLSNIECYLKDNIFWSNWEPITVDDIVSTYNVLKNTEVNKITSSLLAETEIEKNENRFIFKNNKKDVNFLNIFFQPILPKNTIDSLWTDTLLWNFPTQWQIYSWDFKISNISSDLTIWITEIFLDRNEYNNKWNISKLIIKIFQNTNSLLQNKELINIFNDDNNILWSSIPRLENHKYTLPQYVSLFINQNNIENESLRTFIFNKINTDNLLKILWEEKFENVSNPYLWDQTLQKEITDKNFEKIISNLGYLKKSKIIEKYIPAKKEVISNEAEISKEKIKTEIVDIKDEDLIIDKFQEDSKYISKPSFVDKYNFITKDDILLEWKVWSNVSEVYINDYKLSNYKTWDSIFYYRLKESFNSLKEWTNSYKIYFLENWKKELKEEIFFIYNKNKDTLDINTKDFIKNLILSKNKELVKNEVSVPVENNEEVAVKEIVDSEKMEKLNQLDEKFYYNDKLESYSISLYYIWSEKDLETTALFIKNSLIEIWINIELFPISLWDLSKILSEKEKYDMLLTWVNLWYFDYNIFPYFHSSQAKNWYNFSNIKKTSLDILLEDLKSEIKTPEETIKIKEKVLEILKNEQIVKTLYTPKINLLIDKNIKNVNIGSKLIKKSERNSIFETIYVKEEKIINFENKWIIDFLKFLFKKLNV